MSYKWNFYRNLFTHDVALDFFRGVEAYLWLISSDEIRVIIKNPVCTFQKTSVNVNFSLFRIVKDAINMILIDFHKFDGYLIIYYEKQYKFLYEEPYNFHICINTEKTIGTLLLKIQSEKNWI